jgi:hypothetical protein
MKTFLRRTLPAASLALGLLASTVAIAAPAPAAESLKFFTSNTTSEPTALPIGSSGFADRFGTTLSFDTIAGGQLDVTGWSTVTTFLNTYSRSANTNANGKVTGYTDWAKTGATTTAIKTDRMVIEDLSPVYGGLGVVNSRTNDNSPGSDNIGFSSKNLKTAYYKADGQTSVSSGKALVKVTGAQTTAETLQLSFANAVSLSALTLYSDHRDLQTFGGTKTFEMGYLGLDDAWHYQTLGLAQNINLSGITGSKFTFTAQNQMFYVSGATIAPVPEPETYAMFLAGLGLMGAAIARRRRVA